MIESSSRPCLFSGLVSLSLVGAMFTWPAVARAQETASAAPHSILSISICSPSVPGASGACPPGSADTAQAVLGPDGLAVNNWGGMGTLSDEHQTIFPPGTLPGHGDYLLFVATRTTANPTASGLVVLSGGRGPARSGQWTLDFAPDFGNSGVPGQVFLTAMDHAQCPAKVTDPQQQDATFDLNYAAPGSVVVDPTVRGRDGQGALLMVYEGTNRCVGLSAADARYPSNAGNSFYSLIGVATSLDNGHTWPTYKSNFDPHNPLPMSNPTAGPGAPLGAFGADVCAGDNCAASLPPNYGRYAVSGAPVSIGAAMTSLAGKGLDAPAGNSELSAFVDDVPGSSMHAEDSPAARSLYVVYGYHPGPSALGNPPIPQTLTGDQNELAVASAPLNGGKLPLQFRKWKDGAFAEPALGTGNVGAPTPIFAVDPVNGFSKCLDPGQNRVMGSISYVDETRQYLLTFVCISPNGDPGGSSGKAGAAWFYATLDARLFDLSHQEQWSVPREIVGSFSTFKGNNCGRNFSGWYPSLMSLGKRAGRLGRDGFIFYMDGCTDRETTGGRNFSTRAFTITTD